MEEGEVKRGEIIYTFLYAPKDSNSEGGTTAGSGGQARSGRSSSPSSPKSLMPRQAATIYGMGVGFGFWRLLLPLPMRNERSPGEGRKRDEEEGGREGRELH